MNDATTLPEVLDDLTWIKDRLPDLWNARLHGSRPRWRERPLTIEQRRKRDQEKRDEKAALDKQARAYMPGYSRAPLRVEVLDLWVHILTRAHQLHEQIAQTIGHDRLDSPSSAYDNPARYLTYAEHLLPEAVTMDPGLLQRTGHWAAGARVHMRALLGEIEDGQTLKAVCPFCIGRRQGRAIGGEHTMRFRRVPRPANIPAPKGDPTDDGTEMMIVCESGTCEPFSNEVTHSYRGNPAWPWSDWDWLAERLAHINADMPSESA